MSQRRGIAPVNTDGITFQRCTVCATKRVAQAGCCLRSCQGCKRSMPFILSYCSKCSTDKGVCQGCGGSLKKKTSVTTAVLSLRTYLEKQAQAEGNDVQGYLLGQADSITEGNGQLGEEEEQRLVELVGKTNIDPADEKLIRETLQAKGFRRKTQNILIANIIEAVL